MENRNCTRALCMKIDNSDNAIISGAVHIQFEQAAQTQRCIELVRLLERFEHSLRLLETKECQIPDTIPPMRLTIQMAKRPEKHD